MVIVLVMVNILISTTTTTIMKPKKFIYRKKEMQRLNIKKEQRQVYNPIDYEKKSKSGSILNWVVFFVVVVFGVW